MLRRKKLCDSIIFSNLSWNKEVAQRINPDKSNLPGWFAHGLLLAGNEFRCEKNPIISIIRRLASSQSVTLLCFNPSIIYGLLFLLPLPVNRVSLFQWRPLGRLSFLKALFVWFILKRSHTIVVYSHDSGEYLHRYFPNHPIRQIGLYVDTGYFYPGSSVQNAEDFILVPGDHKRDERLLEEIARNLGLTIVRVTRNPRVYKDIREKNFEFVDLRFNVSFDELRTLYQTCRAVLILSESDEIPTGITTLSEALACGADTVITRGHSCSWPPDMQKNLPFVTIPENSDAATISNAVRGLKAEPSHKKARVERSRAFAETQLSPTALAGQWLGVIDTLPFKPVTRIFESK